MVTARIAGIGAALPPLYTQEQLWEDVFRWHFSRSRVAQRIFTASDVRTRHSATDPAEFKAVADWSTAERMVRYGEVAPPLGLEAVRNALDAAGTDPDEIGLLTVVTCTGYRTPGLDIELARMLPLPADARRLLIGHTGCHAALPALATAADYVAAQEQPAVVLCLELTSLHLQPATIDPGQMVSHALFADAAAAVVVRPGASGLRVVDVAARTDTDRRHQMTWDITDLGFRMGLSPEVPDALAEQVGPLVKDLLGRHGHDVRDVAAWAVHPGGPRILDAIEEGLELDPSALAASRKVLAEHGNCSSATVLLVLQELGPQDGPVVALAFGPGLTLYAALLEPEE
ncbi:type III polyketide synthase [Glycomyces tritici]|uniref:3-oxoacyl-[acyl-carrier-protein] synthase III C-terminal domain-containing protein n=1 Tax=Glycomyces tritici TaxID=2665176 RepID=A0ABT7YSQ5_9ACTN|nr:3-oxoacyl-[acyl-carrier-protein] synthase III C-terminal domain-containing protein [Glycomyces tritici]MDN3241675.1 3-oxoacyl-[acyl-carrier-protein] synthase III C-terminal domain-containing protein [Glycomyces tritici]